jgi:hypothetical protein
MDEMNGMGAVADPEQEQPGYTICIKVAPSGMMVGVENESGEAPGDEASEESGFKPVKDIKDALAMAIDIYKNNGQATDTASAESEFSSGFSGKPPASVPVAM